MPKSNRLLSVSILKTILSQQSSLSIQLSKIAEKTPAPHMPLIQEICFGVCRHYFQLHFILTTLLSKPLRKKDLDVFCLLLIGLYQLFFMRIPSHAAINETVEELTGLKKTWAKSLVNAVLREAQRQFPTLTEKINANYCYLYSHPDWLISALKKSWPKQYLQILIANNQRAPMTLRVNLSHTSREEYLQNLSTSSISASPGKLSPSAVILDQPMAVHDLPGFTSGLVSVQDEASQLAAPLLKLLPSHRVLDACSAPGGKTCAMLEIQDELDMVALDNSQSRLNKVEDNLNRISLHAKLICADVNDTEKWWDNKPFDRILLDVPCSATGVIRRHPDIKILRQEKSLQDLQDKQNEILNSVWPLLSPGGLLLYTTCSVLPEENNKRIKSFLARQTNASHLPLNVDWGNNCEVGRQLLPGALNHDGFYYALLQKC